MDKMLLVGEYNPSLNELTGLRLGRMPVYQSKGMQSHMMKKKHFKALKYINDVSSIILAPDYVGTDNSKDDPTIMFVKRYKDNIMIALRLSPSERYLYIATMYDIADNKIDRLVYSGRLKQVIDISGQNDLL